MARTNCEYPGCKERARRADVEHAEWHPEDKRPIYCEPHCAEVDRKGAPIQVQTLCQYKACPHNAYETCFWCKKQVCRPHTSTPLAPTAKNNACPDCGHKIKTAWQTQTLRPSQFDP